MAFEIRPSMSATLPLPSAEHGLKVVNAALLTLGSALLAMQLVHQVVMPIFKEASSLFKSIVYLLAITIVVRIARKNPELSVFFLIFASSIAYISRHVERAPDNKPLPVPPFLIDMSIIDHEQQGFIIGNEKRIARLVVALRNNRKPHAMLVGKTGIGKTALIYGIVKMLKEGQIDKASPLYGKKIFLLDKNVFLSGTSYLGQLQAKNTELIGFTKQNPNVLVFIDEMHTMMSAGISKNNPQSVIQFLKEPIERKEIRIIGATTEEEYEKFMRIDAAFKRRFPRINILEMDPEVCSEVLKYRLKNDPSYQGVDFTDEAIQAIILLTCFSDTENGQPDKALSLMELITNFACDWENKTITPTQVTEIYAQELKMKSQDLLNLLQEYQAMQTSLPLLSEERVQAFIENQAI